MPQGLTFMHQTLSGLFISADGKYYQPRPSVEIPPGTTVTFDVINDPGAPPGFYFAKNVTAVPAASSAPVSVAKATPAATPAAPARPTWANMAAASVAKPAATPAPAATTPAPVVGPAVPAPLRVPRTLTDKQAREDFEAIANKVDHMAWGRNKGFGPSLSVTTKLKWDGQGRELYMRVKEEFHDQKIPGTSLYFFVGTMAVNWGKGGFRISAHTHPVAQITKSTTYDVLHIEN